MLTQDQAKLFSFHQIGACLNQELLSEKDAASILVARAKRKATSKEVVVNSDGSIKA